MQALRASEAALCALLGDAAPFEGAADDVSDATFAALTASAATLEGDVAARSARVAELVTRAKGLFEELVLDTAADASGADAAAAATALATDVAEGEAPRLASCAASATCVGVEAGAVAALEARCVELEAERERRLTRLAELGEEISGLWERLDVPTDEQDAFARSVAGLGMDTLEAGDKELGRLKTLKQGMLGDLVEACRERVRALWAEMNMGEAPFPAMAATEFDDAVLEAHEAEVAALQSRLEHMAPLLKMVAKREEIVVERQMLEDAQHDPKRFDGRNGFKERQKEEKMAKRVKNDLPKITHLLEKRLAEWEKTEGPFLQEGVRYLDTIHASESAWAAHKDAEKAAKESKKRAERESMGLIVDPPRKQVAKRASVVSKGRKPLVPNTHAA